MSLLVDTAFKECVDRFLKLNKDKLITEAAVYSPSLDNEQIFDTILAACSLKLILESLSYNTEIITLNTSNMFSGGTSTLICSYGVYGGTEVRYVLTMFAVTINSSYNSSILEELSRKFYAIFVSIGEAFSVAIDVTTVNTAFDNTEESEDPDPSEASYEIHVTINKATASYCEDMPLVATDNYRDGIIECIRRRHELHRSTIVHNNSVTTRNTFLFASPYPLEDRRGEEPDVVWR